MKLSVSFFIKNNVSKGVEIQSRVHSRMNDLHLQQI